MQVLTSSPPTTLTPAAAIRLHWPEYLMEAACLALFMISACVFGVLLEHPQSPVPQAIENPLTRRALMGLAMGLTAISVICTPWGQRSGAHMNPAVTLSYLTLGRIEPWDATFYIVSQFLGGLSGVMIADAAIGFPLRHSAVNYVVTQPGSGGPWIAFAAEVVISLILMTTVLYVSNSQRLRRLTPFFAGALVAAYITMEAPVSGMSMNPARTFGSAFSAQEFRALWVYFTAPPLGMLLAAQLYRFRFGAHRIFCAKLHHHNSQRCIFRCNYSSLSSHGDLNVR